MTDRDVQGTVTVLTALHRPGVGRPHPEPPEPTTVISMPEPTPIHRAPDEREEVVLGVDTHKDMHVTELGPVVRTPDLWHRVATRKDVRHACALLS